MTEPPDLLLADHCLSRAIADVEAWLALVEQGQHATIAPFGQMFVYQLRTQGRLADKAFAVDELYRPQSGWKMERANRRLLATIGAVPSDDESQQAAAVPEARVVTDVHGIFRPLAD